MTIEDGAGFEDVAMQFTGDAVVEVVEMEGGDKVEEITETKRRHLLNTRVFFACRRFLVDEGAMKDEECAGDGVGDVQMACCCFNLSDTFTIFSRPNTMPDSDRSISWRTCDLKGQTFIFVLHYITWTC